MSRCCMLPVVVVIVLGKDKMDKTFAFSHLKIMREDGAIFPDGTHELFVYKVSTKNTIQFVITLNNT